MKLVINNCYGGFSISNFAHKELLRRKGKDCYFYEWKFGNGYHRIDDDPDKHFSIMVSTKDYGKHTNKIESDHLIPYYRDRDNVNFRTDPDGKIMNTGINAVYVDVILCITALIILLNQNFVRTVESL